MKDENNIFYCTKNNTKWISVDGEKWYGEEKRITELERKNRLLGERCNQLLKDKGDLTDQIADIKANCDLAIEGRDVKIMELEKENAELKNKLTEKVTLESLDVVSAKMNDLEKENAELKKKIGIYQKGMYDEIEKRDKKLTKAIEIIKKLLSCCRNYPQENAEKMEEAEQFLKEIK